MNLIDRAIKELKKEGYSKQRINKALKAHYLKRLEKKNKDYIKQQCNYCGHKVAIYGEVIIYIDPYGDAATNYICANCYWEKEE